LWLFAKLGFDLKCLFGEVMASRGSSWISFVVALGGVPVKELFNDVGYWRRKRVPQLVTPLRSAKKGNCGKTRKVVQVLSLGDVVEVDLPNYISI
jgi:hypothetical protein